MTSSSDRLMLGYAQLAALSRERGQITAAHRFLVLAGIAACRAGRLDVAERCRAVVLAENLKHVLAKHETFPDALRDDEFRPFQRSLERAYPWEQSEHVLHELGIDLESLAAGDPRAATLALL